MKRVVVTLPLLVLAALVASAPAHAKCRRDCKQELASELHTCKQACTKGKPGKVCRVACTKDLKTNRVTCRKATNPTAPACGRTTTTTTLPGASSGVVGALTPTPGRFNYNAAIGLPAASAACNISFAGSHPCSLTELQAAPASALTGLKDTAGTAVTSFWAIDASAAALQQCNDDAPGTGSGKNWEYGTAHTASRGEKLTLDNATGTLGALQTGVQCNLSGSSAVGCCK